MHYGNRVVEVVKFELVCAGLCAERAFVSGVGRDATGTIGAAGLPYLMVILWSSYGCVPLPAEAGFPAIGGTSALSGELRVSE